MSEQPSVTHVVASLTKANGGPSYSVPRLASELSNLNVETVLRTLELDEDKTASTKAKASDSPSNWFARRLAWSPALLAALEEDSQRGRILHTHGLWLMPNIYPAYVKRKAPLTRVIHSPRGMLGKAALDFSRLKKRVMWSTVQHSAINHADCIHATAYSEYEECRAAGLKNPVAIIPNGIDIPAVRSPRSAGPKGKRVLYLGRIHPKKGLENLIQAWAPLEGQHPSWTLHIVGPAEDGHDRDLERLTKQLGLTQVSIEPPVYEDAKWSAYHSSDVFILPTLNENFGLTVAESLAAGVPAISTDGAPWSGLQEERCGWWIPQGRDAMTEALRDAITRTAREREEMGSRGRAWMEREFSWHKVASDMLAVYRWLAGRDEAPACVVFE